MSVGVAFYPDDGSDAEELLAESDRRMYKSKRLRKRSAGVPALLSAGEDKAVPFAGLDESLISAAHP